MNDEATIRELAALIDTAICQHRSGDAIARDVLAIVRKHDGWQPIETAPRDGTIIDLWSPDYGVIHDEWWDDGWCSGLPYAGFTHWRRDRAPDGSFAIHYECDE